MYVGGFEAEYEVLLYSVKNNQWSPLPRHPVRSFGMVHFEGKLVTVGGLISRDENEDVVGTVYQLNKEAQQWVESTTIPPMPTARSTPTLVAQHGSSPAIAACGGLSKQPGNAKYVYPGPCDSQEHKAIGRGPCDLVEVYSSRQRRWSVGVAMPYPLYWTTPVLIGDTCYFSGGRNHSPKGSKHCFSIHLDSLMETASAATQAESEAATERVWQSLPDTPMPWSTAAKLGEKLIAIGGRKNGLSSAAIHFFDHTTNEWKRLEETDLPETCERTTTINLPSHELMIIGGSSHCNVKDVTKSRLFCYKTSAYIVSFAQ